MRLRSARSLVGVSSIVLLPLGLGTLSLLDPAAAREPDEERVQVRSALPVGGVTVQGARTGVVRSATVNFMELGLRERMGFVPKPPVRTLIGNELESEPAEPLVPIGPEALATPAPFVPFVASPSPSASFMGLDDIPMVDSSYIVIPPDVSGAVGLTRILQAFNNNYQVQNKTDGSVYSIVGTATFWNPVVTDKNLLNRLTDPRTVYDPIQHRWIVEMQTVNTNGLILVGVSQTSDPAGNWYLYSFGNLAGGSPYLIDFPNLGFNKNWIAVAINRYSTGGAFQRGITLVLNYEQARAGTPPAATVFTQASGTHFCSSPCATYSASEDTLFVVTHLSTSAATYAVDMITGTPSAPAYATGGTLTRPGGGWVQPSGNVLPQSAPNSGVSACTAPCPIESQDSQVRSAPVYRVDSTTSRGFIYYTQTVGLPSTGLTHTAVQWTKITPSTSPAFAEGGRIEDATATSSNGGKWYAFPHIAVNSVGDFIVGYTQFASSQHPSAGYSYHDHADGLGTIRDPLIFKLGLDYYHKDFGSGRNRWGDFSQSCVDPSDDRSLWTLQVYAKARASTNDGTTGANGSRWSTWWADVAGPAPIVTIAPGLSNNEGASGPTPYSFTVNLSTAYSLPVTVNYQTQDGTATVANNDYQAASGSLVIPAGNTGGTITVNVVGDTQHEPDETFTVKLTGATKGAIGSPSVSTGTILNDDPAIFTIAASAGAGGTISPSGDVNVTQGNNQSFTITLGSCRHVADVLVDGSSVGAVTGYTFTNVQANHTIAASFAADGPYKLSASAGAGGTIGPSSSVAVACGDTVLFTISPDNCHTIADVLVDGGSAGAVATYRFAGVHAGHTIAASFSPTGLALGSTRVNTSCAGMSDGAIDLTVAGGIPGFTYAWSNGASAEDISGLAAGIYAVTVTDARGCRASRSDTVRVSARTISATAGANGSITPPGSVSVACGTNATFNSTPAPGYVIDQLTVDGGNVAAAPSYTFTNVTANHTIQVTFKLQVLAVEPAPADFALGRVIPNPMQGSMHLEYGLPAESAVHLSILDLQGREIAVLADGFQEAGWHPAGWNGGTARGRAPAGLYFARLRAGRRTFVQRFVLTR